MTGGRFPGLKVIAANICRARLQEAPYPFDRSLTDEEWEEVGVYNHVDLEHTWAVLEVFEEELASMAALSLEYGIDLRNTPKQHLLEKLVAKAYQDATDGQDPPRPDDPKTFCYQPPSGVIRPSGAEAAAWYDSIVGVEFPVHETKKGLKAALPSPVITAGSLRLSVGSGGLHSESPKGVYRADIDWDLWYADVRSDYPSLIDIYGFFPRQYGALGKQSFHDILEYRFSLKARLEAATDEAETQRIGPIAAALKRALNSFFGRLGYRYSAIFDLSMMYHITLTGQLMLTNLIESLHNVGVETLWANTDGIIFRCHKGDTAWRPVLEGWQRDTRLVLEVGGLDCLLLNSSSVYATRSLKGKVERHGTLFKGKTDPTTVPNQLVVADAITAALFEGTPPEATILAERLLERFCNITRRNSEDVGHLIDDSDGSRTDTPRVTRWYPARGSTLRLQHTSKKPVKPTKNNPEGVSRRTPAGATAIRLAMDIPPGYFPDDVDYARVIAEAHAKLKEFLGDSYLDPAMLPEGSIAKTVHDHGLTPYPKRRKSMPLGGRADHLTWRWDWPRYPTVACWTGPLTGTLVIDIDDPALFKKAVDRNGSPTRVHLWDDLGTALVSFRGEVDPKQVRCGRGRGKLIFHLGAADGVRLAEMMKKSKRCLGGVKVHVKQDGLKASHGIEIFYGNGAPPSILGEGDEGRDYKLDGVLGEIPAWLLETITPPKRSTKTSKDPSTPRKRRKKPELPIVGNGRLDHGAFEEGSRTSQGAPEGSEDESYQQDVEGASAGHLGLLLEALAEAGLDGQVRWRPKVRNDGYILVGTCPQHRDGQDDLHADFDEEGVPFVSCKHPGCELAAETNRRLRERWEADRASESAEEVERAVEVELKALAVSYLNPAYKVSLHIAPTGTGKTFAKAQVAVWRYRQGLTALVSTSSIKIAKTVVADIEKLAPDAFLAKAVASVFGLNVGKADDSEDSDDSDDATVRYPVDHRTRIVVCCHAQLGRRGFDLFNRGLLNALRPLPADETKGTPARPPFDFIMIDELTAFLKADAIDFATDQRFHEQNRRNGGGFLVPRNDCPLGNYGGKSGGCANCELAHPFGLSYGHVVGEDPKYHLSRLEPVRSLQFTADREGNRELLLRGEPGALVIPPDFLVLDPPTPIRLGDTVSFSRVVGYRDGDRVVPIDPASRRAAPTYPYQRDQDGSEKVVSSIDVLKHVLAFGADLTYVVERAIGPDGEPVPSEELKVLAATGGKDWKDHLVLPRETCEVPRIRGTSMLGVELLRRNSEEFGTTLVFTDACPTGATISTLREAWPDLDVVEHQTERRIRQVLVVAVPGKSGPRGLLDPEGRLVTRPLEEFGKVAVYLPTYASVEDLEAEEHFWAKNPRTKIYSKRKLQYGMPETSDDEADGPWRTVVTSSRGGLGIGVNLPEVNTLVLDCRAFRYEGGFSLKTLTAEDLVKVREDDRVSTLVQNVGRALRYLEGEDEQKLLVVILRNCGTDKHPDKTFVRTLLESKGLTEGCVLSPVCAWVDTVEHAVAIGTAWHEQGGGDVPEILAPETGRPAKGRRSNPDARRREILDAIPAAIADGMTWSQFRDKFNVRRHLSDAEIAEIKSRFGETS